MRTPNKKPETITDRVFAEIESRNGPTAIEIADRICIDRIKVRNCIANLMTNMLIWSDGKRYCRRYYPGKNQAKTIASNNGAPMKSTEGREAPVRNSLMPNGSPEFWRWFLAEMNPPARLDAGKLK